MKGFVVCIVLAVLFTGVLSFAQVEGSGTTNYIPIWTNSTTIGDSVLYQSSSRKFLGINTSVPNQALDVSLGSMVVRGAHNFRSNGDTAFVYVGDQNHPIEAIRGMGSGSGGVAIGAYQHAQQFFIADYTGYVGIGTTTPQYTLDVAGNVNISGNLTKGSGSFKIDHPLDPANKYLYHSFVESPDMMNIYNGNVVTNRDGLATVVLPGYFEALNRDFRYQLTVIGQFAQAIIARKIARNQFIIRTNKPRVEVSWQVTGIRHDAYANAHRIPVEENKPPQEQGHYLHPDLFVAK
jgi:hypothetical protein